MVLHMSDYRQLKVWQKAQSVAVKSHQSAQKFRGNENASFRSQIVRAAFSVPANIVEGNGVQTAAEYSRFVRIAINSNAELEYHLLTARDIGLMRDPAAGDLIEEVIEVRKMLHGLLVYLTCRAKPRK